MLTSFGLVGVLALSSSAIGAESCPDPDKKLFEAVSKYGAKDYEASINLLEEAETCSSDAEYLARVYRQKGLAFDALERRLEAMIAFSRALAQNPAINLVAGEHPASAVRLFDCARSLGHALDDIGFRLRLKPELEKKGWTCPNTKREEVAAAKTEPPKAETKSEARAGGGPGWPVWAAFGAGAVAAGVSGFFSLRAVSKNNDSHAHCSPQDVTACDEDGVTLRSDARSAGNVATIAGILAVVGIGAGAVLWIVAPAENDGATRVSVALGAFGIEGRF